MDTATRYLISRFRVSSRKESTPSRTAIIPGRISCLSAAVIQYLWLGMRCLMEGQAKMESLLLLRKRSH